MPEQKSYVVVIRIKIRHSLFCIRYITARSVFEAAVIYYASFEIATS
jgi:hypothetical protein